MKIDSINEVYVLFRAENRSCSNIDQKFEDNKCKIHRFFDLDEEIKEKIYQLRKNAGEGRELDLYYDEDKSKVEEIISLMREKNLLHYNVNGED